VSAFRCGACGGATRVIDSRTSDEGYRVRRRRECFDCGERVTTEEVPAGLIGSLRQSRSSLEQVAEMLHDTLKNPSGG